MKYKALTSFVGKFNAFKSQIIEITDKQVINDLLSVGYIEEVKGPAKSKRKKVTANDGIETK